MDGGRTRDKKERKVDGHAELNCFLKGCGASHGEDGERVGLSSMYRKHSILYRKCVHFMQGVCAFIQEVCAFYTGSMCSFFIQVVVQIFEVAVCFLGVFPVVLQSLCSLGKSSNLIKQC